MSLLQNISWYVTRATGSREDQIDENEKEIWFYHHDLKIGGEYDEDSNDPEVMDEIEKKARIQMASHFPNVKYSFMDSEKGFWGIKVDEVKEIQEVDF